ncbi:multidrug ABC transporter ATPase [Luteipulveratus mongoliensis]|uniref:Multidrug ABC transporter ATPase n=1 Tax=Luteipulveratus mongoliensis TaxID=571913 RepID=A0A0K1JQY3_9MICO|nr:multidrug ABC transporter ATPase [Luteipulveratus mongoliensis]
MAADRLCVSRGKKQILRDLRFEIPTGSVVGLLGPSGCGKTTLMRTIVGVQRIGSGDLTVLGDRPGSSALRSRIGYVTQAVSVYRDLTVRQNVAYFAALVGAHNGEEAITSVGLQPYADQRVDQLSGGQAGRASLACALVGNPELLVLDEPTVGLDPLTREDLWTYLRSLADRGVTLLISSHVMDEAARCDSVMLMREGRLLQHITPDELLKQTGQDSMDDAFLALIRQEEAA